MDLSQGSVRFDSDDTPASETVRRWDFAELRTPTKTKEGFIRAEGYLTRAGVFPYRRPDGSIKHEFRPEDQVFDAQSLASFSLVPLTLDHPPDLLNPKTVSSHQAGTVGVPTRSGDHVRAEILITRQDAIDAIQAGKHNLSCGYSCKLEQRSGVYTDSAGVVHRFDAVQTQIFGNHVALVATPRAGPQARIRMDTNDAEMAGTEAAIHPGDKVKNLPEQSSERDSFDSATLEVLDTFLTVLDSSDEIPAESKKSVRKKVMDEMIKKSTVRKKTPPVDAGDEAKGSKMDEAEISIGGVAHKVPLAVANEVKRLDSALEQIRGKVAAIESEQKRMDAAQANAAEDSKIVERLELVLLAAPFLKQEPAELVRMDSAQIMSSVVAQEAPEVKLDGAHPEFVKGIFRHVTATKKAPVNTAAILSQQVGNARDAVRKDSSEPDARARMIKNMQDAWKPQVNSAR